MGVTIHYRGVVYCSEEYISKILMQIGDMLKERGVSDYRLLNGFESEEDFRKARELVNLKPVPSWVQKGSFIYTFKPNSKEPRTPTRKMGIRANIHPGCETFDVTFYELGGESVWQIPYTFVKTQFAPVSVHIAICEILWSVDEMLTHKGGNFLVNDEGDYYYTKDLEKLKENFGKVNLLIGRIIGALAMV
ncbi:MAG: hypothetical protein QFX35_01045 [Candidatus Verstraetearchaeota archaeon]|nr:hypothetical protein [Candidatus Verstraetearchaeota archaeon]